LAHTAVRRPGNVVARVRSRANLPGSYGVAVTSDDMHGLLRAPDADCPRCQRRMAPMDRKPIASTDCLVDVTYVCDWCGMEAKRAVREQPKCPTHRTLVTA